uniref:Uncharacterized protein n=1 Tax=Bartonella schoenbuchensis (strain DSM 13525 / NCTC 13165 / R1) TaxID=687861 RepID=E6Z0G0_BARSR|nr:hypothetical protein B11C_40453 [Bartonella schoenbuchensis R1]
MQHCDFKMGYKSLLYKFTLKNKYLVFSILVNSSQTILFNIVVYICTKIPFSYNRYKP